MNTVDALILVIQELEVGRYYAYQTKSDLKYACSLKNGHYPRQVEFDNALKFILSHDNYENFGYLAGTGWYKSKTGLPFRRTLNIQIRNRKEKVTALGQNKIVRM